MKGRPKRTVPAGGAHHEEDELTGGEARPVPEWLWVRVTEEPLDGGRMERALAEAAAGRAGGIVVFSGIVRADPMEEGTVEEIDYEVYEPMASERIAHIRREALSLFDVTEVAIHHRSGRVPLGESSVLVGASAPHRAEAFRAAEYALEEVKRTVPVWKKERAAGSERWVEGGPTEATMGPRLEAKPQRGSGGEALVPGAAAEEPSLWD